MWQPRSMAFSSIATVLALEALAGLSPRVAAQAANTVTVDWPLHNLDLAGSRFSPMDSINRSNV